MRSCASARRPHVEGAVEELRESEAPADPFGLFQGWYAEARDAGISQPDAMALATSTVEGKPSVRMVLFKGVDERGFVFYSNYESRKGGELEANPQAALAFFWSELHRSIRIEGSVVRVSEEESDAYFRTRALGSRLSAAASHQSSVITDRGVLERRVTELADEYGNDVPRPAYWGGYRVIPMAIEFWQGRENRLHDRLRYVRENDGAWRRERLAP
jgi:pyridoxamine 5'-phosphate oxidase